MSDLRVKVQALVTRWNNDANDRLRLGREEDNDFDRGYGAGLKKATRDMGAFASELEAVLSSPVHSEDCAIVVNARHGCTCGATPTEPSDEESFEEFVLDHLADLLAKAEVVFQNRPYVSGSPERWGVLGPIEIDEDLAKLSEPVAAAINLRAEADANRRIRSLFAPRGEAMSEQLAGLIVFHQTWATQYRTLGVTEYADTFEETAKVLSALASQPEVKP